MIGPLSLTFASSFSAFSLWMTPAVSILRLAMRPESLWLLIQLFFTHHIYVWCRAMHVILEEAGIFSDEIYSVSILFAGVICGPVR